MANLFKCSLKANIREMGPHRWNLRIVRVLPDGAELFNSSTIYPSRETAEKVANKKKATIQSVATLEG